jgi:tetratricopeptide (TPR) repeat protein
MQHNYAKAKEILADALKKFPDDNEIMLDMLRIHMAAEEYEDAKELLQQAKNNDPDDEELKEIYLNLGKIAIVEENINEGVEYLRKSLDVGAFGEKDFETEFVLVNVYQQLKQYDKMLEMANAIIKEHGDEPYALSGHYYAAVAMKGIDGADYKAAYKDAIRFYRQFTLQQAGRVDGYVYRAMCHRDLEEYDKAVECLDYVILLAPDRKELHILKSEVLKQMGKEKESAEEKRKAEGMKSSGLPDFLGGE